MTGAASGPSSLATRGRARVGRVAIDVLTFAEAIDAIEGLVRGGHGGTVFTPNVDHVVLAEHEPEFREAYARANLSLVDGAPVVLASRVLGTPLPERVAGADLVRPLMRRAAERGFRVYLLGGAPGVAASAKEKLEAEHPGLKIVGVASPRVDLAADATSQAPILDAIASARPDILLLALGAPKQEIWAERIRERVKPAVILGIGAALDFIAGTARRAPAWVSKAGFEWLYRLMQEPGRLWRRYLLRDPEFLAIVGRQMLSRGSSP
jgi:N-acetylglucosaminyldiphosphoundecaprenol N-acetyl-beta-D-mannosaminyltransferase